MSKRATSILTLAVALFVTVLVFKLLGVDKLTAARLLPPPFGAAAGVCVTARDHERNDRLGAVVIGALVALAAVYAVVPPLSVQATLANALAEESDRFLRNGSAFRQDLRGAGPSENPLRGSFLLLQSFGDSVCVVGISKNRQEL